MNALRDPRQGTPSAARQRASVPLGYRIRSQLTSLAPRAAGLTSSAPRPSPAVRAHQSRSPAHERERSLGGGRAGLVRRGEVVLRGGTPVREGGVTSSEENNRASSRQPLLISYHYLTGGLSRSFSSSCRLGARVCRFRTAPVLAPVLRLQSRPVRVPSSPLHSRCLWPGKRDTELS